MDLTFDSLEEYSDKMEVCRVYFKSICPKPNDLLVSYLFHNSKESICNRPWRLAYCREEPQNPAEANFKNQAHSKKKHWVKI